MTRFKKGCAVAALSLAFPLAMISAGNALPAAASHALSAPMATTTADGVTQVRWRGRGGYHHHRGWGGGGVGIGIASGLLLGGALAAGAAQPYYGGPGYYYGPRYAPAPVYDDSEAYCMQRYKSYDPASGTYLNYDGNRYPCP